MFKVTAPAFCAPATVGSDGPFNVTKEVGEVHAADGQADDRGEDVLDPAVHHRGG